MSATADRYQANVDALTERGFIIGALHAGRRLGIITFETWADRRDWHDRIELAAQRRPDLAAVFPTNDRERARLAHEELAREAAMTELQYRLDLWR